MAKKPRTPAPPRPVQAPQRRDAPRARAAGPGAGPDRRLVLLAAGAVAVLAAIGIALWVALGGSSASGPKPVDFGSLSGLQTGPPPWNNGTATLPDRLGSLGLEQLTTEGTVIHTHQHLDLYVNGKKVTVPTDVGIYANDWLTQIHTHVGEPDIIHVESPTHREYSLGEFFGVWGVRLTPSCVGEYCGKLRWWVDGKQQSGNPADLVLKEHQEIAVALGTPPTVVPSSFDFAKLGL